MQIILSSFYFFRPEAYILERYMTPMGASHPTKSPSAAMLSFLKNFCQFSKLSKMQKLWGYFPVTRSQPLQQPLLSILPVIRKEFEVPPYSQSVELGSQIQLRCHPPKGVPKPRVSVPKWYVSCSSLILSSNRASHFVKLYIFNCLVSCLFIVIV